MEANHTPAYKRTVRRLMVACGVLFSVFSFIYLYVFQKDVMEALHFSLSDGKTQYSPFWTATVVTLVLLLLRVGVNALAGLKSVFHSLDYFPSCLCLGVLTDVGYTVYHEGLDDRWTWLFPLLLIGFALLVFVLRKIFRWWLDIEQESGVLVNTNLFILLILCLMTLGIGNTNIHFHHELAVEAALRKGDYDKAAEVGYKMMDPSRSLTALRAYTLSKKGTMGDVLFQCPQLYGADGLLPDPSDSKTLRITADSLYTYLGDSPHKGERTVDFFRRMCEEETGNHTALEYYLSALLLDKQLPAFVEAWHSLYEAEDSLPRHYKEALFLYEKMYPTVTPTVVDEAMNQQWHAYDSLKHELGGTLGEGNYMRRKFGDTYWWYYEY